MREDKRVGGRGEDDGREIRWEIKRKRGRNEG